MKSTNGLLDKKQNTTTCHLEFGTCINPEYHFFFFFFWIKIEHGSTVRVQLVLSAVGFGVTSVASTARTRRRSRNEIFVRP